MAAAESAPPPADQGSDSMDKKAKVSPALKIFSLFDRVNLLCISLCAILCLTIWGSIFYTHSFEAERRKNRLVFCDFAKYYVCAKIATSQDRLAAYDFKLQSDYTVRYALGDPKVTEEFIHYPPIDFPLMSPLAFFSIEQAYLAFSLFGSALFAAGTWLLNKTTGFCLKHKNMIYFWLAVAGSVPMLRTFVLGQSSFILTGVAAFYVLALLLNRSFAGGAALALTSIKPQYSIFLVIPALAQKRYKLLAAAALSEILLLLWAVATIGFKNILDYPSILFHSEQNAALAGAFVAEMVNVRGLLAIALGDGFAAKAAAALAILALAFLAYAWFKFCPKTCETNSITGRLLLCTTVMFCLTFSPHTHLYDCLFIAVAALLAGKSSLRQVVEDQFEENQNKMTRAEKILAALFIFYPLAGWLFLYMPVPGDGTGAARTAPFAFYNLILSVVSMAALFSRTKGTEVQN